MCHNLHNISYPFFFFMKYIISICKVIVVSICCLWAIQLVEDLDVVEVWFESNSKLCMDTLLETTSIFWHVHDIINNMKYQALFVNHLSWLGLWVSHKANGASHALAGWSFKSCCWGPLNFCDEPSSFVNACFTDQRLLSINWFLYIVSCWVVSLLMKHYSHKKIIKKKKSSINLLPPLIDSKHMPRGY